MRNKDIFQQVQEYKSTEGVQHIFNHKRSFTNLMMKLSLMVILTFLGVNSLLAQSCFVPTNVAAGTITPTSAVINWDVAQNATSYEVNYIPQNAPATIGWTTVAAPTNTTTLTSLNTNTVYVAVIRSVCGADYSDYTTQVVFSTQTCQPPNGLTFSNIAQTSVDLQWNIMSGANGYKILSRQVISGQNPGAWNMGTTVNNNYILTGLTANSLYAVRLMSDCGALSDTSAETLVSTGDCAVPNGLMVSGMTPSSLSLQWNAVNGATQYNIEYREMGALVWNQVNSNTNSKTINGLSGNTQYELRVRSRCGGNTYSGYSVPISGYTLPCAMPVNAMVSNVGVSDATITWNNATGATQYKLDYREANNIAWTTVNANNTTKTLTNLTPNTNYQVRLRAKCSGNQYSAYTDTLVFSTKECGMPSNFRIEDISINSVKLAWNDGLNATRYKLDYRIVNTPNWTTINVNANYRTINNLDNSLVYEARLRSQCGNNGIYSEIVDTLTFRLGFCTPPSGFNVNNVSYTSATFNWDVAYLTDQYTLSYKPVNSNTWLTRNSNQTQVTINNLVFGTNYHARITSSCNNVISYWSDTITFRTENCDSPTYAWLDTITYNSATIKWSEVLNHNSYKFDYRIVGDTNWITRNSPTDSINLNNLSQGVLYEGKARSVCGNVNSNDSYIIRFQTKVCPSVFNLNVDTLSNTSLKLNWASEDFAQSYRIEYKRDIDSVWTIRNTTDTVFTLNNLLNITENNYQIRLKTKCDVQVFSVAIPATQEPCTIHLTLDDLCPFPRIYVNGDHLGNFDPYTITLSNSVGTPLVSHVVRNWDSYTSPAGSSAFGIGTGLNPPRDIWVDNFAAQNSLPAQPGSTLANGLGVNPLAPGTYTLCVQSFFDCDNMHDGVQPAQSCTTFTVAPNLSIDDITINGANKCAGGGEVTIGVVVTSTSPTITYEWFPKKATKYSTDPTAKVNPSTTTTYTVNVSDGCNTIPVEVEVFVSTPPTVNLSCPSIGCLNSTVSITGTYNINGSLVNPLSFQGNWNSGSSLGSVTSRTYTGLNGPYTDVYQVTLTSNPTIVSLTVVDPFTGCVSTQQCSIIVSTPPVVSVTVTPATISPGGSATLTANVTPTGFYGYAWSPAVVGTGATVSTGPIAVSTTYTVTVTDLLTGCTGTAAVQVVVFDSTCVCPEIVDKSEHGLCNYDVFTLCVEHFPAATTSYIFDIPGMAPILSTSPCINVTIPIFSLPSLSQISVVLLDASGTQLGSAAILVSSLIPIGGVSNSYLVVDTRASDLIVRLGGNNVITPALLGTLSPPLPARGTIQFNQNFTIDVPISFLGMNIEILNSGVTFDVMPGATPSPNLLTINNSFVHGRGISSLWGGIRLQGTTNLSRRPELVMRNTVLENASQGVSILNPSTSVVFAYIQADSVCFNENNIHIDILRANMSSLVPYNGTRFIQTPLILRTSELNCKRPLLGSGLNTFIGVNINNVPTSEVGSVQPNNLFVATRNVFRNCAYGILADVTSMSADGNDFAQLYDHPAFTGDVAGISCGGFNLSSSSGNYFIGNNYANLFTGNNITGQGIRTGIQVFGYRLNSLIRTNIFQNIFNTTGLVSERAILVDNVYGNNNSFSAVTIQSNIMLSVSRGVEMNYNPLIGFSTPSLTLAINGNVFSPCQQAIYLNQPLLEGASVAVTSNSFGPYQNFSGFPSPTDAHIFSQRSGFPATIQATTLIQDNFLIQPNIGILLLNSHQTPTLPAQIFDNTINNAAVTSIQLTNAHGSDVVNNIINSDAIYPAALLVTQGIHLQASTNTRVKCNRITGVNYAFEGDFDNRPNTHLVYNVFRNCSSGVFLNNGGIIGAQGGGSYLDPIDLGLDPNLAVANFNLWNTTGAGACNRGVSTNLSNGALSPFNVTDGGIPPYCQNPILGPFCNIGSDVIISSGPPLSTATNPCSGGDWIRFTNKTNIDPLAINYRLASEIKVARNQNEYVINPVEAKYIAEQNLFATLHQKVALRNESAVLDSFYQAKKNSNMAKLIQIDKLMVTSFSDALAVNESITPQNGIEQNQVNFNRIYLNWLNKTNQSTTTSSSSEVMAIANLCPLTGGKSVFQARALLSAMEGYLRKYVDDCKSAQTTPVLQLKSTPIKKGSQISLYPNPATTKVTVSFSGLEEEVKLTIVDIRGIEVYQTTLNGKNGNIDISTQNWTSGIYACRWINKEGNIVGTQKLIVNK